VFVTNNTWFMHAAQTQQSRAAAIASMTASANEEAAIYAAIAASTMVFSRSALLFAEAPVHVLHLDSLLLAALRCLLAPHALVITANARRHLTKGHARPNPDHIREALGRIFYISQRKPNAEQAELIGLHSSGRYLLACIVQLKDPTAQVGPEWYVSTAWWLNDKKLRQLRSSGKLRPYAASAV
jgi:hypothetical protein